MRNVDLVIQITDVCNLRCQMCEIPRQSKFRFMNFEHIKKLIDSSKKVARSIALTGGEPFLHPDIFKIIFYAKERGLEVYIPSNGTLINKESAEKLRDLKVDAINISIEGPKEIHDLLRGKNNFKKAIDAIKLLKQNKVNTTLAMTVMKQNYIHMAYLMELAHYYKVKTVKYQPFNKDFLKNKSASKLFLIKDSKKLKTQIQHVLYLSKKYQINTNPKFYLLKILEYFKNQGKIKSKSCFVPCFSASIDLEGNVLPCWPMSYNKIGNIQENEFMTIWKSPKFNVARKDASLGKCPGCLMSCHENIQTSMLKIFLRRNIDFFIKKLSKIKKAIYGKINENIKQKRFLNDFNKEKLQIITELREMDRLLSSKIKKI